MHHEIDIVRISSRQLPGETHSLSVLIAVEKMHHEIDIVRISSKQLPSEKHL